MVEHSLKMSARAEHLLRRPTDVQEKLERASAVAVAGVSTRSRNTQKNFW